MVACTFVSEDLEAVQDGLSLPDSNRVHLFYLESQTLIQVQDLILSVKWFLFSFFFFLLSIICQCYRKTILCSKANVARQSTATLSSTKPYLPVLYQRSVHRSCHKRCVCASVFVAHLGIGDSMNKQKADNVSDVTPWPHFIFREGIFLQLLGKVASLPHETTCVSSHRFSCSDAQIATCSRTTRNHVRPCLWHNHLGSDRGDGERMLY